MKTYQANNEFVEVLLKQGFQDFTTDKEKTKGLTVYKLAKADKKSIAIEGTSIYINPDGALVESLTEEDLKIVLLYCTLITNDFKETSPKGKLIFEQNIETLTVLKAEYLVLLATEGKSTKKIKLTRVFEALDKIESLLK